MVEQLGLGIEVEIDDRLPLSVDIVRMYQPDSDKFGIVEDIGVCTYELHGKLMVAKSVYDNLIAKTRKH